MCFLNELIKPSLGRVCVLDGRSRLHQHVGGSDEHLLRRAGLAPGFGVGDHPTATVGAEVSRHIVASQL
jgi:hypothetical protein